MLFSVTIIIKLMVENVLLQKEMALSTYYHCDEETSERTLDIRVSLFLCDIFCQTNYVHAVQYVSMLESVCSTRLLK